MRQRVTLILRSFVVTFGPEDYVRLREIRDGDQVVAHNARVGGIHLDGQHEVRNWSGMDGYAPTSASGRIVARTRDDKLQSELAAPAKTSSIKFFIPSRPLIRSPLLPASAYMATISIP